MNHHIETLRHLHREADDTEAEALGWAISLLEKEGETIKLGGTSPHPVWPEMLKFDDKWGKDTNEKIFMNQYEMGQKINEIITLIKEHLK